MLPGNSAWKAVNIGTKLIFGEFGDWPKMLTADSDEDALCWVIFLEDLMPREILFSEKKEDILKAIHYLEMILERDYKDK